MRAPVVCLYAALLAACGGGIDRAALREEVRREIRAEIEAEQARAHASEHEGFEPPPLELPDVERVRVPLEGAPRRGGARPLVTIVEIAEYQCPFSQRVQPTLARIREELGEDVAIVFRHNPLPFHQDALPAAEAAMEALAQGGPDLFWRLHDVLFENQRRLGRTELLGYAAALGMDTARVARALDEHPHRPRVQADMDLATRLNARGTPSFFVNGRPLRGAQPYERFMAVVREELALARGLEARGTPRDAIYATLMRDASDDPPAPAPAPAPPEDPPLRAPGAGRPAIGPADARVTVVMFTDLQCPFCARAHQTVERLWQHYGGQIRLVFRHNPLPFHHRAMPAAEAAEQVFDELGGPGFYRFIESVYQGQRQLDDATLVTLARQAGATAATVRAALADHRHRATVEADQRLATAVGARGTPAFFINGHRMMGAQPFERLREVIDREMAEAQRLVDEGTAPADVYERLQRDAREPGAPAPG